MQGFVDVCLNTISEFKKHNISIPYNQLEVRLRDDEVEISLLLVGGYRMKLLDFQAIAC